jgi:threonine/homoserine/homoserine lactone efflux protein
MEWFLVSLSFLLIQSIMLILALAFYVFVPLGFMYLIYLFIKGLMNDN